MLSRREQSIQYSTMVLLVEDHPGVLTKVSMVLRRRGFNIASLSVGHSEQPGVSRMTIVVEGIGPRIKQCEKQLYKLIEVLKVYDLTEYDRVDKELAIVRISGQGAKRAEITGAAQAFDAEIVDLGRDYVTCQITASPYTIERFLEMVSDFGIMELTRTGVVTMARGSKAGMGAQPMEQTEKEVTNQDGTL